MNDKFRGSPFWQEIRTGLFVIGDYGWQKVLSTLPEMLDPDMVIGELQTNEQMLASNFTGHAVIRGAPVDVRPDVNVLAEALPPNGHYNQEALFLQWMYHYYILEGVSNGFREVPLAQWSKGMLQFVERNLHFLVYVSAVMCLMEDGMINGAPAKEGMASLLPMVQDRIQKITTILLNKTADYGESFRRHGMQGTIPRIWDKVARYAQLSALGRTAQYEPKTDALTDLLGYCVIAWSLVLEVSLPEETLCPTFQA
jgi:hypothetical protein